MAAETDMSLPLFTQVVIGYPGIVATSVAVVAAITLWAIWSRQRLAGLIAAIGIVSLGVGTQVLWSAATYPWFQMINMMGQ